MMSSWWLLWMAFMFFLLVSPVGYAWGYRGWGPPYPSYIQRRRARQAATAGGSSSFNHHAWGRAGDVVWIVLLVGLLWACTALWWH